MADSCQCMNWHEFIMWHELTWIDMNMTWIDMNMTWIHSLQYCKVISLQLIKINEKKKKKEIKKITSAVKQTNKKLNP